MTEERRSTSPVEHAPSHTGGAASEATATEADRRLTPFQAVNLQFERAAELLVRGNGLVVHIPRMSCGPTPPPR